MVIVFKQQHTINLIIMTNPAQIPKQDPRYVLLDKINKKYYDDDEHCYVVTLPIKKYKDYVYKFYDHPTHPVSTIEVFVIDDFERWYASDCIGDMYSCHVKESFIYTYGINRISYDDKRIQFLENNLSFHI